MKLTKAQGRALSFIRDAGAVSIDAYGSLVRDDGEKTNSAGATTAARLVALGLVTGRDGLLMLTEQGMRNALPTWPSKETA
jgi:hypothetical protein